MLGGETLSGIVREWNELGLTTVSGGPWRVNSLSSLLVQPRLAGVDDRRRGPARPVAPIVDLDVHARLVALHAARGKGTRRPTRKYLLSGMLRCWRCGGGMRGMPRTRGADLYVCPGPAHGGCSGTAVTADHADDAVRDLVLARLDSPSLVAAAAAPTAAQHARARRNLHELAAHSQRLGDLADMWVAGEISRVEWLALKRKLGRRAKAAEDEAARLARLDALRAMAGTGWALGARWPTLPVDDRRRILQAALDHVVVLAAAPPRQVFRPERLQPHWLD